MYSISARLAYDVPSFVSKHKIYPANVFTKFKLKQQKV